MPIQSEDIAENLRLISLSGRLDIIGTEEISTKFAAFSCVDNKRVIVDLTQISFLASIGIRELISNGKSLQKRGGRMVLLVGQNETVIKTLEATGIDMLLPMFNQIEAAKEALQASTN